MSIKLVIDAGDTRLLDINKCQEYKDLTLKESVEYVMKFKEDQRAVWAVSESPDELKQLRTIFVDFLIYKHFLIDIFYLNDCKFRSLREPVFPKTHYCLIIDFLR